MICLWSAQQTSSAWRFCLLSDVEILENKLQAQKHLSVNKTIDKWSHNWRHMNRLGNLRKLGSSNLLWCSWCWLHNGYPGLFFWRTHNYPLEKGSFLNSLCFCGNRFFSAIAETRCTEPLLKYHYILDEELIIYCYFRWPNARCLFSVTSCILRLSTAWSRLRLLSYW